MNDLDMFNELYIGKLFCKHDWEVVDNVGQDWRSQFALSILCKCKKCNKLKARFNFMIDSIPEELIKENVKYN